MHDKTLAQLKAAREEIRRLQNGTPTATPTPKPFTPVERAVMSPTQMPPPKPQTPPVKRPREKQTFKPVIRHLEDEDDDDFWVSKMPTDPAKIVDFINSSLNAFNPKK
jgi:hypothetical protein